MKKVTMGPGVLLSVVLLVVTLAAARPVSAQVDLTWGPRFGVGLQTVVFEDPATDSQTDPLLGFHVGVALERTLTGPLSVEVDVLVSREGFRGEGAHTGDLRRDFLALPILFKLRTPTRVSAHVTAGAAAKLGVRCVRTHVALAGSVGCGDPVMGADWARLDVAATVGAGVAFPWGGRTLTGDLLLSSGLRDLDGGSSMPGSAKSLAVGVSFAVLSPWGVAGAGGAS